VVVVGAEEGDLTAVEEDVVEEEEAEMAVEEETGDEEEMAVIAEGEVGAAAVVVEEDARLRFKLKVSRMGIMHVAY